MIGLNPNVVNFDQSFCPLRKNEKHFSLFDRQEDEKIGQKMWRQRGGKIDLPLHVDARPELVARDLPSASGKKI